MVVPPYDDWRAKLSRPTLVHLEMVTVKPIETVVRCREVARNSDLGIATAARSGAEPKPRVISGTLKPESVSIMRIFGERVVRAPGVETAIDVRRSCRGRPQWDSK